MVMEPMIARDIEKKFFFREVAKEMGFTALKTGIAYLNKPYDSEYLNKNFSLGMLTPKEGKEKIYRAYMSKMISTVENDGNIIYKNFGVTVVTPDANHVDRIVEVAKAFDMPYIEIDPTNPNSIGLNPFTIGNPGLCGLIISLVIRGMFEPFTATAELAYSEDVSTQAIQNLVILLKVMYPRMHDGLMPNLEDLLKCFNHFDWVEEMCEELKKDEELAKEYELQLGYFKQYFYKDSEGRKDMQRHVHFASSTLDIFLRSAQIRSIVCNRYHNISFAEVIDGGQLVFVSTRPYEIGGTQHKGLGLFFLMLMMCSVESNREEVKNRLPHFIYVDEFDRYNAKDLSDMYTIYRKFKIGTIFSAQSMRSLYDGEKYNGTLLSNAATKITFGNTDPDEMVMWMNEFGKRKEWEAGYTYNRGDVEYSDKFGIGWNWTDHMKLGKIQGLKFKNVIYKIKDKKGKSVVNFGNVDFLESKYKTQHKSKNYNFNKYTSDSSGDKKEDKPAKWNPNKVKFTKDDRGDIDPIQTDTTDSSYFFDNEDAISFNLGNNNNNNQ